MRSARRRAAFRPIGATSRAPFSTESLLAWRLQRPAAVRVLELRGGDRSELSATLVAIERTERFTALRSLAMHGLAVLGVVLWLDVVVPGLLPGLATRCALALFALLAVGAGAALVLERRWLRIQRRLLATADRTGDPARG